MATSVNTPTPQAPPAGASAYERISALTAGITSQFSEGSNGSSSGDAPADTGTGTEAAAVPEVLEPEATPAAPAPAVQAEPVREATPQPKAPKAAKEPANPYDEEVLGTEIPKDVLDTFMLTPQGKEILQSHRALSELAKPLNENGIGRVPTTQEIRNYYLAFRDQTLMNGDLNSGDTQKLGRFFGHVFNPQRGEQQNVSIASQIPTFLADQPALYAAVMEPFLKHYQDTLIDRFKETRGYREGVDDKDADALWLAASLLNNDISGAYLDPNEYAPANGNGAAPVLNTVDPKFAAEKARFEQERSEFQRQQQQQSDNHQKSWINAYNGKVGELLMSELDQALAQLKTLYANAPNAYNALRRQFHDEVVAAMNSNTVGMELHSTELGHALRAGTLQSAHAVAQAYRDRARDVIRANRKKFLEGAGVSMMTNNQQRHSEAAAIDQNRVAGGGSGGAPSPVQNPPITKQEGESQNDFIHRMVKAATANSARSLAKR